MPVEFLFLSKMVFYPPPEPPESTTGIQIISARKIKLPHLPYSNGSIIIQMDEEYVAAFGMHVATL